MRSRLTRLGVSLSDLPMRLPGLRVCLAGRREPLTDKSAVLAHPAPRLPAMRVCLPDQRERQHRVRVCLTQV